MLPALLLLLLAPAALADTAPPRRLKALSALADARRALRSWLGSLAHRHSATFQHFLNSRVDELAIEADRRGVAFLKMCEAYYRPNDSTPVVMDDGEVCSVPDFECSKATRRYRTHDGTCNNLAKPGCGRANSALLRMLPASYADGIYKPRLAKSGKPLPSARYIQLNVFSDRRINSHFFTLYLMQHGQLVSHDLALSSVRQTASGPLQCCASDGSGSLPPSQLPDACMSIPIPRDDPVYKRYNLRCMEFVRAMTVPPDDCVLQPAVAMNAVTSHLDLSAVYGNSDAANAKLRKGHGGRLRSKIYSMREFLPLTENSPAPCNSKNDTGTEDVCFLGGDVRVNQNPLMASTHVINLREHNQIADNLAEINPHWDDECLYQESRRIAIAFYQHITYEEMLPVFIGREAFQKYFQNNTYDEDLCAGIFVPFTTVVYRYFHTIIHGFLRITALTKDRKTIEQLDLGENFNYPSKIIEHCEGLLIGSVTQPCRKEDEQFDEQIAHHMFRATPDSPGLSLPSFDINRGRDHGVPPYNDLREKCGLPRAHNFDDLIDTTSRAAIAKMKKVYEHIDDVDALVGGALENNVKGALMGPTFLCLFVNQFILLKKSDRFFYTNKEQEYPFTEKQLEEIKKASIARLMCDHTGVHKMQKQAFLQISKSNPLVDCKDIPKPDLSAWKEESQEDKKW